MVVSAAFQYARNAAFPRTIPPDSGTTRAAIGEVKTTSSWK